MAECIISTAQHAKPKVRGQRDPDLDQDIKDTNLVKSQSSFIT